jgi:two-component system, chemotaxis family, sensor kinase CheA
VQVAERRHGLVVDEVLGREEIVIKPLGAMLSKLPGFAGGTITGDGRIALIADLPELLKSLDSRPKTLTELH